MTTVLVTGANRGIGLEFVRQYAADGARVLACARVPSAADALIALAEGSGGRVTIHPLDVGSAASVEHLKHEVAETPIDILLNNAGVYGGDHQSVGDIDFESWMRTLAVNTIGPARMFEAFRSNLLKSVEKKCVAVTSGMASTARNEGGAVIYRSSKAALNNVMRTLALAGRTQDLIVVPLDPGWVKTDMGGKNAPLSAAASVKAMRALIAGFTLADSGRYWRHDGQEIPW
jgi:NAD(P)-dependent dehydrogenase (short-subunit alcohol dehydrogenase family)